MTKRKFGIGIDFGATSIKIALVNRIGKVIVKSVIPTKDLKTPADFVSAICNQIFIILKNKRLSKIAVCGIGVGIPGFVDKSGRVLRLTNIKGWKNFALKNAIEKNTKIHTFIDNDANVMALAELSFGATRGFKDAICITLGTGVGGAVIINGKLYRGSSSFAGEIGHIPVNSIGPRCKCGGIACLERYVGNQYIVENFIKKIKNKKTTIVTKLVKGNLSKITPQILSDAARLKDRLAVTTWKEIGEYIGVAVSCVINLLNPQIVVIGGGVAGAGKILLDSIKNTVRKRAIPLLTKDVKITRAKLGQDAGVIGAACLTWGYQK